MNFKIFLLSVLLLKSCEFGESFDNPVVTPIPVTVKVMFINQTTDNLYVWFESVYGDQRHEYGNILEAPPYKLDTIEIASRKATIHQMMSEDKLRNRLDTLYVYVARSMDEYDNWCLKKNENVMVDCNCYLYRYTIVKSNIDDIMGAGELIPVCYKGV